MPLLNTPMELGAPPSLLRRVVRTSLLAAVVVVVFLAGLSVTVLVLTP